MTGSFYMDGRPFRILSGSFHYFRTHPEQWLDRLEKMKAAGLNTISTYIPWNLYEEIRGEFQFEGFWNLLKIHRAGSKYGSVYDRTPRALYLCRMGTRWVSCLDAPWPIHDIPFFQISDVSQTRREVLQPASAQPRSIHLQTWWTDHRCPGGKRIWESTHHRRGIYQIHRELIPCQQYQWVTVHIRFIVESRLRWVSWSAADRQFCRQRKGTSSAIENIQSRHASDGERILVWMVWPVGEKAFNIEARYFRTSRGWCTIDESFDT